MEKVKFIERRLIFVDDIKKLCIAKNWYTLDDRKCFEKMLNKCKKSNITTEDIIEIVKDCFKIAEIAHSYFERIILDGTE